MPATNKVGTQLLVSPHVRADVQALALVRQESVAEVYRVALEGGGLPKLKRDHAGALLALDALLTEIGPDRVAALEVITRMKIRTGDLQDAGARGRVRLALNGATVPANA